MLLFSNPSPLTGPKTCGWRWTSAACTCWRRAAATCWPPTSTRAWWTSPPASTTCSSSPGQTRNRARSLSTPTRYDRVCWLSITDIYSVFPGVPDVKSDQRIHGEDRGNPRKAPDRDGEREWSSDKSPVICRSLTSWMLVLYKNMEYFDWKKLPNITARHCPSNLNIWCI